MRIIRKKAWVWFWAAACAVFLADRLIKVLLEGEDRVLWEGVFRITTAYNPGAAMSLFSGNPVRMTAVAAFGMAAVLYVALAFAKGGTALVSLGLIFGGAAGNLADRLLRGYVIDLFELLFIRFWIFNFADAAITAGCALCAFLLIFRYERNWKGSGTDAGAC